MPALISLDLRAGTLHSVVRLAADVQHNVPVADWRELPCDGSWIRRFNASG